MTATATRTAFPKKLRDGSWGLLIHTETAATGDTVQVTTKSGKTWTATVGKILWHGDGKAIAAEAKQAKSRGSRPDGIHRCLDCGGRLSDFDRDAACVPGYHFDCA